MKRALVDADITDGTAPAIIGSNVKTNFTLEVTVLTKLSGGFRTQVENDPTLVDLKETTEVEVETGSLPSEATATNVEKVSSMKTWRFWNT